MPNRPMNEVLQHIRQTVLDDAPTDGQLLENYLERRDRSALEAIVRRHGRMVWGVCCRVLSNHHDTGDAFQATFLVLVRKAASIMPRAMVANWLHGVAHQTALKARATLAKRNGREKHVGTLPEPAAPRHETRRDLQQLLDEELTRLPDRYRAVIVLCDLEGKTRKEAARHLGCPEGTVAGRLARARVMLAKRLARYGFAVSGGVIAMNTASALPASVVAATLEAAAGHESAKVAALTEGVLRIMLLKKLKFVTSVLVTVGLLFSTGTFFVPSGEAGVGGETEAQQAADPSGVAGAVRQSESPKAAAVQVLIKGPHGMKVQVLTHKNLVAPGRLDLEQGKLYHLKLSEIPSRPGLERFPTLEIPKVTAAIKSFVATSAIPVELFDRDFDAVSEGTAITKVVYLETKSGDATTIASYDAPGVDLIAEANRRGTILAVLRMGNIERAGSLVEIEIGNDGTQGRVVWLDKAKDERIEQLAKQLDVMTREAATVQAENEQLRQRLKKAELEVRSLQTLLEQKKQSNATVSVTFSHDKLPVNADKLAPLLRQMAWDKYHDERLTVRTTRPVETLALIGPKESVEWASGVIKALNAAR